MHRSPRVVVAWVIAALVAIVTARVVTTDLATLHRRARSLGADTQVLSAARDLPLGATLQSHDLQSLARPASLVPPDALRARSDQIGRVVAVPVLKGDIVREAHLAPAERRGADGVIPLGHRAVHVIVHDGFQPPVGAVVDVLAAFEAIGAGEGSAASVVAAGARVLAVDSPNESTSADASGVTVLVTEAEARRVAFASINGRVTIALAPPEAACCEGRGP